ncbi:MAG: hypothetical protein JWP35_4702 [Caulobacter sp.]|nr:hypothetical protein [Caulobacter sp.]
MSTAIAPIQGTTGNDTLTGDIGNDNIYAGAGDDILFGGEGDDNLRGGSGSDHLYGGAGNDMLNGDDGADIMEGGLGDDTYVVDDAGDQVIEAGGEGYDSVKASISYTLTANVERLDLMGAANLTATGNALDNTLKGNSGDNILSGLAGKDSLAGGDGHDTLIGGAGHDWLQGGAGADDFMLDAVGATETAGAISTKTLNSTSSDAITDFTHGLDRIVVQANDYAGVNAGVLDAANFVAGTAATAAHAQFIYDAAHKALLYDADGTGSGKAVKIADINAGATVTASDIFVQTSGPAHVLDFEDAGPGQYILGGDYHGFDITSPSGMVVDDYNWFHSFEQNTGFRAMEGSIAIWSNSGGSPIEIQKSDHSDFVFQGMDLSAGNRPGQTMPLTLTGYLDGNVVFSTDFTGGPAIIHLAGGFTIDDLQLTGGDYINVIIDNIGYDNIIPHG